jgi:hypothetical protein
LGLFLHLVLGHDEILLPAQLLEREVALDRCLDGRPRDRRVLFVVLGRDELLELLVGDTALRGKWDVRRGTREVGGGRWKV